MIKIPLSTEKTSTGIWHDIDTTVYQNQRTINGSNPKVLQNDGNNTDNGKGIIALAMAIGEEITGRTNFDINRLDGGDPAEIFLNGKVIDGISLKEKIEYPNVSINKLKEVIGKENTIITASVKENNDGSFKTITGGDDKPNHGITITKIVNENNKEYIQYYDPNYSGLKKILADNFLKKCYYYQVFCKTDDKYNYPQVGKEKSYYEEKNKNTPGIIVENTGKPDYTLRKLRGDFITYQEDNKTIVKSRSKKAEIEIEPEDKVVMHWYINGQEVKGESLYASVIKFENTNVNLNFFRHKLSNEYKGENNNQYIEHLYLPGIANFMNRMIYNYIDTKARNKDNSSPFSLNKLGWLVLDDDPYHVNLNTVDLSQRENIKKDWEERKKAKERFWNDKLVCLRDWSKLGIDKKETKQSIVEALNSMVREKSSK